MTHLNLSMYLHLSKEKRNTDNILQKGKCKGPQRVLTICSLVRLHFDEQQEWVPI